MTTRRSEEVVWEDPPPEAKVVGQSLWERRLSPLMDRPGQWARVFTSDKPNSAKGTVSSLTSGKLALPGGTKPEQWEFRASSSDAGSAVHARFKGPKDQKDTKYGSETSNLTDSAPKGPAGEGSHGLVDPTEVPPEVRDAAPEGDTAAGVAPGGYGPADDANPKTENPSNYAKTSDEGQVLIGDDLGLDDLDLSPPEDEDKPKNMAPKDENEDDFLSAVDDILGGKPDKGS